MFQNDINDTVWVNFSSENRESFFHCKYIAIDAIKMTSTWNSLRKEILHGEKKFEKL